MDQVSADLRETPEGHLVEYDASGRPIALELFDVRGKLEREGELTITCPYEQHVERATLEPALTDA